MGRCFTSGAARLLLNAPHPGRARPGEAAHRRGRDQLLHRGPAVESAHGHRGKLRPNIAGDGERAWRRFGRIAFDTLVPAVGKWCPSCLRLKFRMKH